MATKKVIDMSTRADGANFDDYVYITAESPNTDERWPAAYMREFVLDGVTGGNGVKATAAGSAASTNTTVDLELDINELTPLGAAADAADTLAIYDDTSSSVKKVTVSNLLASSTGHVTEIIGGDGITASASVGPVTLTADLKANGGLVIENSPGEIAIDLAASSITGALADGDIASAATWNAKQAALTFGIADTNSVVIDSASVADNDYAKFTASGLEGRTASETKTDLSLDNVENTALSTWTGSTNVTTLGTVATGTWDATAVGVTKGGTGLTTVAKGSVLAVNAADTISAVAGVTNGHVLTYDSAADTVGWAAPGHAVGTVTSVGFVGGSGISFSGTNPVTGDNVGTEATFAIDLTANGGLEASAAGDAGTLQVAQGISQHDVAQFDTGVVDDDFLRINGTAVEGRSASEVLSDIGAQAALTFGIADTNAVKIDSATVADNDYAKFTASGLEGRTASETKTDLSLDNVENTALSTWAGTTNITTLGTIASGTWEGTTVALDQGGTGMTSIAKGSVLVANAADTLSAASGVTDGHILTYTSSSDTVGWAAPPASGVTAGFSIAMAVAL
jgi:hypothetical protein